jgi:glyoxylase-like metal-dependent hydrolase (beta-lactamase superfamily II)
MGAPFAGVQASSVYRHKVGAFEITVLSDGNLALEATLFSGDQARAEQLLEAAFLPKVGIPTAVNEWLINTGEKLILIDTGASNVFLPTLGRLPRNLVAAGVDPNAVDAVVITHMHPDHVPGLLAADGTMMFKNAIVHIDGDEYAFWTSDQIRDKAPDAVRPFFDLAKRAIKSYADAGKVEMHRDGTMFAAGIAAVAAPGHTVGHTMVRISSEGSELLIWGDIVHNAALQFPEADRSIAFDHDPTMAIANRKKVFDMVANDRLLFAGSHLPFPGLGHAAKTLSGYTYVPLPYAEHL